MPIKIKDYNGIPWEKLVYYDETSPTFIRYVHGNTVANHNQRIAHEVAGYCSFKNGLPNYARLKYQGKSYLIHRIIYILHHGSLVEGCVVNHINFNTHDNSINNLEACTFRENLSRTQIARKLKLNLRNCSGINGVHELVKNNGYKLYHYAVATWVTLSGEKKQKLFSYERYGKELAWALAIAFRKTMEIKLSEEGRL